MKEDYLILEIQKIGQLLRKIVNRLQGPVTAADMEEITQQLNEHLHLNISNLNATPDDDFLEELKANKAFTADNLQLLADVLLQLGMKVADEEEKRVLYGKSFALYRYVSELTHTFSVEREEKMGDIQDYLN